MAIVKPFDQVIFACHSDQALACLTNPTPNEAQFLRAFNYQENHVVCHSDLRFMPHKKQPGLVGSILRTVIAQPTLALLTG